MNQLKEAIQQLKSIPHYECDDGWYSCPKTDSYFGHYEDEPISKRPCYCDKGRIKPIMDKLLEVEKQFDRLYLAVQEMGYHNPNRNDTESYLLNLSLWAVGVRAKPDANDYGFVAPDESILRNYLESTFD